MAPDGPELRVRFGVPHQLCQQKLRACCGAQAAVGWAPMPDGLPVAQLRSGHLVVEVRAEDARCVLMAAPSPMRPAINL